MFNSYSLESLVRFKISDTYVCFSQLFLIYEVCVIVETLDLWIHFSITYRRTSSFCSEVIVIMFNVRHLSLG